MLAHLGWALVVIAAIGLIKFAIDKEHRWWRLIVIILVLGAVAIGVLWVLGATGWQLDRQAGPAPTPSVSAAQVVPRSGVVTASPLAGMKPAMKSALRSVTRGESAVLALRWQATGPGGRLFPALDADIWLTPPGSIPPGCRWPGSTGLRSLCWVRAWTRRSFTGWPTRQCGGPCWPAWRPGGTTACQRPAAGGRITASGWACSNR